MKMRGRLTEAKVAKANRVGRVSDGQGRYLRVSSIGGRVTKNWIFKFVSPLPHPNGPRVDSKGRPKAWVRDMGFGAVGDPYDLDAFRLEALKARTLVYQGIDPIEDRRIKKGTAKAESVKATTFAQCAKECIKGLSVTWRGGMGGRQAAQWEQSLRDHAYSVLGQLPVAMVEKAHVLAVLTPLWSDKTVTADRLRGRIEQVLDWARAHGLRSGDNPAQWRGGLEHALPKASKVKTVTHLAALPYVEIPSFMARLRAREGTVARLIEFVILTGSRLGEAQGARWGEIDVDAGVWSVPPGRMKGKREHRVPLSDRALEILSEMPQREGSALVFSGLRNADRPVSATRISDVLKEVAAPAVVTSHGFRSSFCDWANDCTGYQRETIEAALAHQTGDKVELAYKRSDVLVKRRSLMNDWSSYCAGAPVAAQVIKLARTA
jgi:integrase